MDSDTNKPTDEFLRKEQERQRPQKCDDMTEAQLLQRASSDHNLWESAKAQAELNRRDREYRNAQLTKQLRVSGLAAVTGLSAAITAIIQLFR